MRLFGATFTILLLLSCGAFAQTKNIKELRQQTKIFKNNRYYDIVYDKSRNLTEIEFYGAMIGGRTKLLFNGAMIGFGAGTVFPGESLSKTPEEVEIRLATHLRSPSYMESREIFLIADGRRYELTQGKREFETNNGNVRAQSFGGTAYITEKFSYKIKRSELETFAGAQQLMLSISGQKYELNGAQQQVLKDLLLISEIK